MAEGLRHGPSRKQVRVDRSITKGMQLLLQSGCVALHKFGLEDVDKNTTIGIFSTEFSGHIES